ncbi:MAG: TIGR02186 family protein, partial [Bacteroidota bacterium]
RKARVAGIWINRDELRFSGVPAFYRIAASKPLADFVPLSLRQRHQIGVDFLRIQPQRAENNQYWYEKPRGHGSYSKRCWVFFSRCPPFWQIFPSFFQFLARDSVEKPSLILARGLHIIYVQ